MMQSCASAAKLRAAGPFSPRLEDDDLRRAVEVTEAEERYTKAALDRLAVLVERQVAARSAYDRAKATIIVLRVAPR